MEDLNWDTVKFTICIILDVIAFIVTLRLTNYFSKNRQNYLIPIAIISILWMQTIIILVLKYQFFSINWIQIGFSIFATIYSLKNIICNTDKVTKPQQNSDFRKIQANLSLEQIQLLEVYKEVELLLKQKNYYNQE